MSCIMLIQVLQGFYSPILGWTKASTENTFLGIFMDF